MRRSGATIRHGAGRLLVFAGAVALGWSAFTFVSGGFALPVGPLALSFRDPVRPLIAAAILLAAARLLRPRAEFGATVGLVTGGPDRLAARIVCAAAAAVLVFSIAWNTRAAGGSDSSCYVLQAEAFAHGQLRLTDSLSAVLPGATPAMFAPTGFVPSRIIPFTAVPICGPGLALAMTAASVVRRDAVFLVVPLFAALTVWLTFLLGRRLDDGVTGASAALLLATSPIFLYQSVQPMSDVPAAALWLAALTATARDDQRGQILGGVCASLAVLMRPNLALIVIPLAFLSFRLKAETTETNFSVRLRAETTELGFVVSAFRRNVLFLLAMAPGLAVLAWLNAARYGSPMASGYGSADALFSVAHVGSNLARYPRWLFETETPFIAAAALAPWWAGRNPARLRLVLVSLAAIVLTLGTYLAYTVFDDWWYIRFLLPALPPAIVLSVAVLLRAVSWLPPSAFARSASADRRSLGGGWSGGRTRPAAAVILCVALCGWRLHVARTHHVFDLQALESRFGVTGRYVSKSLPETAVVLAVQHTGSVRYYGGRSTIAWDAVAPGSLDATIAWLRGHGHPAFIVLEDAEEPRFRARFVGERFGGLDWPPQAEINGPVRVRVYDPSDLERYRGGEAIATAHVRD
jgi:hypothetical protein